MWSIINESSNVKYPTFPISRQKHSPALVSTVYFRYACTMSRPFHWSNSKSMRWQRWVTWFSHSSIPLRVLQPFWTAFNAWIREFSLTLQCCWIPECCTGSAQGKCLGRTSRVHTTNSESSIKIAFPSRSPDFRCSTNLTYGFLIVRPTYVFPVLRSIIA